MPLQFGFSDRAQRLLVAVEREYARPQQQTAIAAMPTSKRWFTRHGVGREAAIRLRGRPHDCSAKPCTNTPHCDPANFGCQITRANGACHQRRGAGGAPLPALKHVAVHDSEVTATPATVGPRGGPTMAATGHRGAGSVTAAPPSSHDPGRRSASLPVRTSGSTRTRCRAAWRRSCVRRRHRNSPIRCSRR